MGMRMLALFMATAMGLAAPAAKPTVESVEYKGFGVVEVSFVEACDWTNAATIELTDADGNAVEYEVLGGDEDDCFLRIADPRENAACEMRVSSEGQTQHVDFDVITGREYAVGAYGEVTVRYNDDPCDWCGSLDHDDDYCPQRWAGQEFVWGQQPGAPSGGGDGSAQGQPGGTANVRCDECGEYGHDDDHCPYQRCDICGQLGHDDDNCPERQQGQKQERCDICGKTGHDDDHCPERQQGQKQERCDICGQTGHDDDHCPNQRCDICGKTGHDDDHCPERQQGQKQDRDDDDDDDDDDNDRRGGKQRDDDDDDDDDRRGGAKQSKPRRDHDDDDDDDDDDD